MLLALPMLLAFLPVLLAFLLFLSLPSKVTLRCPRLRRHEGWPALLRGRLSPSAESVVLQLSCRVLQSVV